MPRRSQVTARGAVLVVLALLAAFSAAAALYLRSRAGEAEQAAEAARKRLEEERLLAAEYRRAGPEKLVISADATEAHSSEYIARALRDNGIATDEITYNNPQETSGSLLKVTTEIDIKNTTFASLLAFLRDVQENRPQLTLLEADIEREGKADKWKGSLTYGALIPATPRS